MDLVRDVIERVRGRVAGVYEQRDGGMLLLGPSGETVILHRAIGRYVLIDGSVWSPAYAPAMILQKLGIQ